MKIFIWSDLAELTNSYHEEGGLVVISKDMESAINLLKKKSEENSYPKLHPRFKAEYFKLPEPDLEKEILSEEEQIFIMPNAGCC